MSDRLERAVRDARKASPIYQQALRELARLDSL